MILSVIENPKGFVSINFLDDNSHEAIASASFDFGGRTLSGSLASLLVVVVGQLTGMQDVELINKKEDIVVFRLK